MSWWQWILVILGLMIILPAIIRQCFFMGAEGFYKARSKYINRFKKGGNDNG